MSRLQRLPQLLVTISVVFLVISATLFAQPKEQDVLKAMVKATDFMMNTVSVNGGFVWKYTADLSDQWGEVPARKSMIWVQDPGTIGVGNMLLEAYKTTGDEQYLRYAKRIADALVWGQYPSGGWHYFIDFDMTGLRQWYDEVASKCWGWEEYYHYYGNCTYDDNVTSDATRYLLNLYMTTFDPTYRVPLIKALDFILESQYPNGGWPQRYPLKYDYPHDGHEDYTSFYTFNDNVIQGNIHLLIETWEKLGNEEYIKAAYRGMDFLIISQLASPQAGWGQQYDMDMNSAPARSYEPASVMPGQTAQCIEDLEIFYMITGNKKYLRGIPEAIEWLENSYLPDSDKSNDRVTHATFYELGTNKPLYAHREGTSIETGRYWIDYEPRNFPGHYGMQTRINVEAIKNEYERVNALTPEEAQAEYKAKKSTSERKREVEPETVKKLLDSMDNRGAWVEKLNVPDYIDLIHNPRKEFMGISTATYIKNMETLINYIENLKR
ncbi:MAG: pectate lyase [Candidatus Latescibacteria bacterium]|nr:pectate lyase [Candidatus Latescibacterota bacterium]